MTAAVAGVAGTAPATALYRRVSERAASLEVGISPEELAELAVRLDMGEDELAALEAVFMYLADKRHGQVISTLLKLSRLPQRSPKTFEGFDFDRIRGRDAAALRKLPALSNLHARKNLAFIGPGGIGKTHLAQAYGRACCLEGFKMYYLKATELRDKLKKTADSGSTSRAVAALSSKHSRYRQSTGLVPAINNIWYREYTESGTAIPPASSWRSSLACSAPPNLCSARRWRCGSGSSRPSARPRFAGTTRSARAAML